MNATLVLKKILQNLALVKEEEELTYAKLADGTILQSPTFDVGEDVDVVSDSGTKTAAPDGEHEIVLSDSEGKEERIKIITKDGKIVERENVEVKTKAEDEAVEMESIAGDDMGDDDKEDDEETAEPISEDMKKDEEMKKKIEEMTYRIEELEKKYNEMVKEKVVEEGEKAEEVKAEPLPGDKAEKMAAVDSEEEEEELPKLDGAPIDENAQKVLNIKFNKTLKVENYQNSVLSKLYK